MEFGKRRPIYRLRGRNSRRDSRKRKPSELWRVAIVLLRLRTSVIIDRGRLGGQKPIELWESDLLQFHMPPGIYRRLRGGRKPKGVRRLFRTIGMIDRRLGGQSLIDHIGVTRVTAPSTGISGVVVMTRMVMAVMAVAAVVVMMMAAMTSPDRFPSQTFRCPLLFLSPVIFFGFMMFYFSTLLLYLVVMSF
ncbi:hypothetical protein B0H65DRAFT_219919 [Neurospora tetraspora]|uniref:Transmembrane protein n=1 Tax=Neurospora tetraspora TaxID=94610 RepID=A0AAE0JCF1_9PEZI|nr:hypothetical protein B0H65DRAFT_219919 [Neurospora tetraspora]